MSIFAKAFGQPSVDFSTLMQNRGLISNDHKLNDAIK